MINLKSQRKKPLFLLLVLFFVVFAVIDSRMVKAATAGNCTFQWQANPPEENVIGYRLYYGPQSRYDSAGSLKENFSYPQYIDFMDQVRCSDTDYSYCEALSSQDVQCENLYSEAPKCTVNGLSGTLYFTMTAYTSTTESAFTVEIQSTTPQQLEAMVQIINMLLLSD